MPEGIGFSVRAILKDSRQINDLLNTLRQGIDLNIRTDEALNNIRAVQEAVDRLRESMSGINFDNLGNIPNSNNHSSNGNTGASSGGSNFSGGDNGLSNFNFDSVSGQVQGIISGLRIAYDETNNWTGATLTTLDGYKRITYELQNIRGQAQVTNERTEDYRIQQAINDRLSYQKQILNEINELERKRISSGEQTSSLYQDRINYLREQLRILEQNINAEDVLSQKQRQDLNILQEKNRFKVQEAEANARQRAETREINELYKEQQRLLKERTKLEVDLVTIAHELKNEKQSEINLISQKINSNRDELSRSQFLNEAQKENLSNLERQEQYLIRIAQQSKEIRENSKYGETIAQGSSLKDLESSLWWMQNITGKAEIIRQTSSSVDSLGNSISQMTLRTKTDQNQWQKYNLVLDETNNKIHLVSQSTSDIINYQQQLSNMLVSAIERFALWGIAMKAWTSISSSISECIGYVKELDEAMNNIRRITMDTQSEAMNLAKTYNQIALDLSASTLEVANAAGTWLRQGFSSEETNTLVKDSIILSKLAMIDSASATQYLTSTLKGYKLEAEEVIGVIDKMVTIDFNAATTAQDVAEALSRCANMARTSGVDINQAMSMIATVLSVTQKSASVVGEAFKTMFSRMSAIKSENLVDPESAESLNDVETTLNGLGIKLRENSSEFRDFGILLDEIAEKWSSFSDVQKAAVSSALGGTRQRENVVALFENYDQVKSLEKSAYEATGTAMEKYEVYQESITAKQAELNARFQEFFSILMDSGIVKVFYDISNILMSFMNAANGTAGKIVLLTAAFTGLYLILNNARMTTLIRTIGSGLASIPGAIRNIINSVRGLASAQQVAEAGTQRQIAAERVLINEESKRVVVEDAVNAKLATQNTLAAANPYLAVITAVLMVASVVKGIIDSINESQQEAINKSKELMESYSSSTSQTSGNIQNLEKMKSEYKELSKGVDEYGNNISLSADKYQRYKEIVSAVLGYSPSLITGYNKEGEAITNKNGLIEKSIELLKEENKQKLQNMVSDESLKTLLNGTSVQIRQAEKSFGNIKAPEFLIPKSYNLFTPENIFSSSLEGSFKTEVLSANLRQTLQNITGVQIKLGQNINRYIAENFESISGNLNIVKDKYSQIVEEQYRNNLRKPSIKLDSESENTLIQYVREKASKEINEYMKAIASAQREIETAQKTFNPTLQLIAQASEGYDSLSDAGKNIVTKFVDGIRVQTDSDRQQLKRQIQDFVSVLSDPQNLAVDSFGNEASIGDMFSKLLSLDKAKLKVSEYREQYKELVDSIFNSEQIRDFAQSHGITIEDLKVRLKIGNIDINSEKIENVATRAIEQSYKNIDETANNEAENLTLGKEEIERKFTELQDFLSNLSVEDFEIFTEMVNNNQIDLSTINSYDDLTEAIERFKATIQDTASLQDNIKALEDLQKNYDILAGAVDEYNENGYITIKTLEGLLSLGSEYISLLSIENGQLVLNEQALRDMLTAKMQDTQITMLDSVLTEALAAAEREAADATGELTGNTQSQSGVLDAHTNAIKNNNLALADRFDKLKSLTGFKVNENGMVEYSGTSEGVKAAVSSYNNYKQLMDNVLSTSRTSVSKVLRSSSGSRTRTPRTKTPRTPRAGRTRSSTPRSKSSSSRNEINKALNELKGKVADLERPFDIVEKRLKALGHVTTLEGKAKEADLVAQKFRILSNNLGTVQNMLSSPSLSKDMREFLENKVFEYMAQITAIRDKIGSNIKEILELEKKNSLLKSELEYKEKLFTVEKQLYGSKGKELWEHEEQERIKSLQKIIDAREKEKSQKQAINEEEQYQNKLLEARLKLQNALENKTTKILTQQSDGSWQFEYSFNPQAVKEAQTELKNVQKEYDNWIYDKDTKKYKDEAEAIEKEIKRKNEIYDNSKFYFDRSYEAQKNSIEKYYADISEMTNDYMAKLEKQYGASWDKIIVSIQMKLYELDKLSREMSSKKQYGFSSAGFNNKYINPVHFDTGGYVNEEGIAYIDKKERVLSADQTYSFEKLVNFIPKLMNSFSISKFHGIENNVIPEIKKSNNKRITFEKVECIFPNAKNSDEIQNAILELPRLALQTI